VSPDARQRMLDAAAVLEALRPAADRAIGGDGDQPIRDAWDKARAELRRACAAWVSAQ
jgi:hypothetical protein